MGKKNGLCLAALFLLFFWCCTTRKVSAAIELKSDDDGNITWLTEPTMATSGIKWRTQGFLLYAQPTAYGYPLRSGAPYGKILIDDTRVSVTTDFDAKENKYISKFVIDADYTKSVITSNAELYAQFKENAAAGQAYIYFNNFFQSYRANGDGTETVLTSNMYDIDSIRNDQWWANKNEWDTGYYNIRIPYKVTSNVHVKLVDSSGNNLGTSAGFSNPAGVEILNVAADGVAKRNPMLAFYNQRYDALGLCDSARSVYVGDTVKVSLPLQVVAGGETYELYRSYYYQTTDDTVRRADTKWKTDRAGTVTKEIRLDLKSARVVGRYQKVGVDPVEPEEGEIREGDFTEAEPVGIIGAGTLYASGFNVTQGIPATESLYTQIRTPKYLAGYRFARKTGVKTYIARGTITWNLTWTEGEGEDAVTKTAVQVVTYTAPVERTYSYWEISNLEVYSLSGAQVSNGAFPAGSVSLTPDGYTAPSVTYSHDASVDAHVRQPDEISQLLNLGTMSYPASAPPAYDATALLNARVGECKVRNDSLVFNGQTIMSAAETTKTTSEPGVINTEPEDIPAKTLYAEELVIPAAKANGTYGSGGAATYGRIAAVNPVRAASLTFPAEEINSVTVHTPVVCEPWITDEKSWCQLSEPTDGYRNLILHTAFYVSLPAVGSHRSIQGYGTRDYGKYTAARQVRFPFDTYKGTDTFIPAGTWTDVGVDTRFYLPPWVKEGRYSVRFRSISINAAANGGTNLTERQANLSLGNYVAAESIPVEVSGRVYGFELYDISDYPMWERVFRDPWNRLSGTRYTVGTRNEFGKDNGQEKKFTLPVVNGSHPDYINQGAVSTGYVFRFRLKTIGDYDGKNDFIRITPKFYFVKEDGSSRQEVDIYYSERFQSTGEREDLVLIGSERDKRNTHRIKTGDWYMSLPEKELETTARINGVAKEKWMNQDKEVFTFGEIRIPDSLMTFTQTELPVDPALAGKSEDEVAEHMQTWYGKYYLPKEIHVCPKDFDLHAWYLTHGAFDFQEEFWLKKGYVMIRFEIETIRNGMRHLSYINAENAANGYCNMWQMEGGVRSRTDYGGGVFEVRDGDVVLYHADRSVQEDYTYDGVY